MKADLHTHTIESDGKLTQEALFKKAKAKGVDVLAITDHDVCARVEKNRALAKTHDMTYIPGIELSTLKDGKSVHLLGYFRDDSYQAEPMQAYYTYIREGRENRAKRFIENLKRFYDISITYEQVVSHSDGIIARPHIARAIMDAYPYTHDEIFDRFLGEHAKAYVPSTELSTEEGIRLLRRFDIVISLAHPGLISDKVREEVLEYDYDAIEAVYPLHTDADEVRFKAFAESRGQFITAGSDYHGIDDDSSHGELGSTPLEGEALERFLAAMRLK